MIFSHLIKLTMRSLHLIIPLFVGLLVLDSCEKTPSPSIITAMQPLSGGYGTEVVITGTNFSDQIKENSVTINNLEAEVLNATSTSVSFRVPALPEGEWPVKITTEAGIASAGMFSYQYTVYVAGCENNSSARNIGRYWKNGTPVLLTDGTTPVTIQCTSETATFSSDFIIGDDIFIAGSERTSDIDHACYWRNGVKFNLTDGTKLSIANGILVR